MGFAGLLSKAFADDAAVFNNHAADSRIRRAVKTSFLGQLQRTAHI
jgi:hypothetical protein